MSNFTTVKNLPIPPIQTKGRKRNKFEEHLATMDIHDAVQDLTMNEVQQFYVAAKKLGRKVTARVDQPGESIGPERLFTIWRIE